MKPDINKFSFGQLTSNTNGKTSGSGFSGVYIVFLSMICFVMGVIDKMFLSKTPDVMSYSIMAVTIGAGLLGYRKSKEGSLPEPVITETEKSSDAVAEPEEKEISEENKEVEEESADSNNEK